MRIPCVIDNYEHRLADVLNEVLAEPEGGAYDSAKRDVLGRDDSRLICFEFLIGG